MTGNFPFPRPQHKSSGFDLQVFSCFGAVEPFDGFHAQRSSFAWVVASLSGLIHEEMQVTAKRYQ